MKKAARRGLTWFAPGGRSWATTGSRRARRHTVAPGRVRRNMPNPVPLMVLGRLTVDLKCQGRGIGSALLRDAVLRTVQGADIA
jgi:GNAT superfamily N-acetyltransferase